MMSHAMDVVPVRIPRRKENINLLTGVFQKSVNFLNSEMSKSIIVGIFKNRGISLGLAFCGRHGPVFWSYNVFNELFNYFNEITLAIENKHRIYKKLDTGEDIKVQSIFGKQHVFLYDNEHTITLTSTEWIQFINALPCIIRTMKHLFLCENFIRDYIIQLLQAKDDSFIHPPLGVPHHLIDMIFDEVQYYKRWPTAISINS